jgi:hypothetical protein
MALAFARPSPPEETAAVHLRIPCGIAARFRRGSPLSLPLAALRTVLHSVFRFENSLQPAAREADVNSVPLLHTS